MSSQRFVVNWLNWVIKPTLLFAVILLLFWWLDVDKRLAYYLSHQPGGFPYAFSPEYEFIFHRVPKVISGTLYIGMLVLATMLLPWISWLEKILPRSWCKIFTLSIIAKLRNALRRFPAGTAASLWICILAIVFSGEMIGHLKRASSVDCPITIQAFGGEKLVPLENVHEPFPSFGEGGQCWPGGHSLTGFLFLSSFFGFMRMGMRKAAMIGLVVALLYGNFLGLTQVYRGQHYLSHQLWSFYLVWMFGLIFFIFCGFLQSKLIRFFLKQ